jgi:hypothetical protein
MKKVGYSFLIGGVLGCLAQVVFALMSIIFTNPDFILGETLASDTLVGMGIIGAFMGGLGLYHRLESKGTFGSLLPFSGFAFAVGLKMIQPWTKHKSFLSSVLSGLWLVIWFNVLAFGGTFLIAAFFYYGCGIHSNTQFALALPTLKPTGALVYLTAFITAGLICSLWQIVLNIVKCSPVWILLTAWLFGGLLCPTGIMAWLGSFGGWGINVMIMNGGQILYNNAFQFFNGDSTAMFHFTVLAVTIGGLFLTGVLCFILRKRVWILLMNLRFQIGCNHVLGA